MSASSKKKLRNEQEAVKMTERQIAEQQEAKKLKLYTTAFVVVLAVILVLAITIGVLVCIAAILQFVFAMAATNRQLKFYIRISVSVLTLSAGVVTFVAQESAIAVLTTLFGLLLIIDGAFKLQTTIQSKRYHVAGWWILLGIAVTTILGGFFLTKFAPDSQSLLALLLGFVMVKLLDRSMTKKGEVYTITGYGKGPNA